MWRSVGFLMSFAVVLEGMTLIAYIVILAGGKQKREAGWGVLSGLHVLCAALQCAGMAIIVSPFSFYFAYTRWKRWQRRCQALGFVYGAFLVESY